MNSSVMFFSVRGCRGLCSHGKIWVPFSGDIFHYRFFFPMLLGQLFFIQQGSCEPSSGRFHLNSWPYARSVPCAFSHPAPAAPQCVVGLPSYSHFPVVIRYLWSDGEMGSCIFFFLRLNGKSRTDFARPLLLDIYQNL